jgi:hypothetical protein
MLEQYGYPSIHRGRADLKPFETPLVICDVKCDCSAMAAPTITQDGAAASKSGRVKQCHFNANRPKTGGAQDRVISAYKKLITTALSEDKQP